MLARTTSAGAERGVGPGQEPWRCSDRGAVLIIKLPAVFSLHHCLPFPELAYGCHNLTMYIPTSPPSSTPRHTPWQVLRCFASHSNANSRGRGGSGVSPEVLLVSLKAGGVGMNLTAASQVHLMDPWWNPAVEEQVGGGGGEAREERGGEGQGGRGFIWKPPCLLLHG